MSGTLPPVVITPFRFTGRGGQYFRIWIVNLILTLGIYSAWAKVRTRRYFLGNTWFGESSFDYHATPLMILKGRLIALGLALIYVVTSNLWPAIGSLMLLLFMLAMPWVIWRSLRFNSVMTSYRNVRFGFDGRLKESYVVFLLLPMLPVLLFLLPMFGAAMVGGAAEHEMEQGFLVFGLGMLFALLAGLAITPYAHKRSAAYVLGNLRYGQGHFETDLNTRRFYSIYLAYLLWFLLIVIVGSLVVAGLFGNTLVGMAEEVNPGGGVPSEMLAAMMLAYVPMLLLGVWTRAWFEVKVRNYAFSQMRLDDKLQMTSSLRIARLVWIHASNLLLLALTLGLAWPWTRIRLTRYKTETAAAELQGDLDTYVSQQQGAVSALGEEMGDVFDVAPELGF